MSWKSLVWDRVEEFKQEFPCDELDNVPIDSLYIAEVVMELDIIPFPDLDRDFGIDAAILSDFSGLYIDRDIYLGIDRLQRYMQNRLRFSVAHEIGHYCLHQEEFRRSGFKTAGALFEWIRSLGGRKDDVEREANEFAGRLLIPRDKLLDRFRPFEESLVNISPHWFTNMDLRDQAAERLAERFGVHPTSMRTRFDRENIWPKPW